MLTPDVNLKFCLAQTLNDINKFIEMSIATSKKYYSVKKPTISKDRVLDFLFDMSADLDSSPQEYN